MMEPYLVVALAWLWLMGMGPTRIALFEPHFPWEKPQPGVEFWLNAVGVVFWPVLMTITLFVSLAAVIRDELS